MTVIGSDNDATLEVLAENPQNEPPAQDHRYVIVRLRATYNGEGRSTFDGGGRLAALHGQVYPSQGRPCGDISDELQNPAVTDGGNVCFEAHNSANQPLVIDRRSQHPVLAPYFSRFTPEDQTEASPYQSEQPAVTR